MNFFLNIMLLVTVTSQSIETPKYQLIKKFEKFEIRDYGTVITAKTAINASFRESTYTGFRRVANYIFGGNNQEKKIAMTAPVITQMKNAQSHIVHFVMPSEYNLESLPDPNLQSVKIEEEKLGVIAAMRFGGWATEKKSNRYIQIFLNQLKEKDIQIIGDIRVAQYNGPTTIPPFRKNEILIPVSYK